MRPEQLPNLISILRLLLVPPVLALLLYQQYTAALVVFLIAGASDGLDGFLARRYGWQSRLGGFLDPLADKLLVVTTFLALAAQGLVPEALAVAVVTRDVIIVVGALAYHYLLGAFDAEPMLLSKLNTLLQLSVVLAVLAPPAWWPLEPDQLAVVLQGLFVLSLVAVCLSGAAYVLKWGWRALRALRGYHS